MKGVYKQPEVAEPRVGWQTGRRLPPPLPSPRSFAMAIGQSRESDSPVNDFIQFLVVSFDTLTSLSTAFNFLCFLDFLLFLLKKYIKGAVCVQYQEAQEI